MAGNQPHGWMAATNLVLTILSTATLLNMAAAEFQADSTQPQGKSVYYNLDKEKLRQLWYLGTVRGLIKMKARAALEDTSWIENHVYQQCEKNAKSTVELAKCAVKVFDARDYQQKENVEIETKKKPVVNISIKKAASAVILPSPVSYNTSQTEPKPGYNTKQQERQYLKSRKGLYYKSGYGWVKNPIRAQSRVRRVKRDVIEDAWDLFLKEEREKKKRSRVRAAGVATKRIEEQLERNILGMERVQTRNRRQKRKVQPDPIVPIVGTKPALDYSKLALTYLKNFVGGSSAEFSNIEKLKQIKEYVDKADVVKAYFKLINDENKGLMKKFGIQSEDPQVEKDASDILAEVLEQVNAFAAKHQHDPSFANGKLSIMSPRLFSILPDKKTKNRLLSPTVFSFQDDGFFSVPDMLDIVTSDKRYQQNMLEMILELSGGSEALDKALGSMKSVMADLNNVHYPLMQDLSKHDHNWIRAKRSFSDEQNDDFDRYGYAYLTKEQMDLMYSNKKFTNSQGMNTTALGAMTKEEKDKWVEKQIRHIAQHGRKDWPFWAGRRKRQAGHGAEGEPHSGVEWLTLQPIAFTNFINQGSALEIVTLSPRAFVGEIINPEALTVHTLSPRAFIATVLSPSALVARILSPGAFRAEVLSPRALQAWVLIPEAFIAEVLTPHFLEPKILSPEALVIFVLSPKFLSPHVMSGETLGVVVLSPHILSPRIASEEKMLVEILSPHILGGSHSHEEAHHEIVEVGSHTAHSDAGHPDETHDEHGHAIIQPKTGADHVTESDGGHHDHHPVRK